jgi:hypothetical protein
MSWALPRKKLPRASVAKLRYTTGSFFQPESEPRVLFCSSPKHKAMAFGLDCDDPELADGLVVRKFVESMQ